MSCVACVEDALQTFKLRQIAAARQNPAKLYERRFNHTGSLGYPEEPIPACRSRDLRLRTGFESMEHAAIHCERVKCDERGERGIAHLWAIALTLSARAAPNSVSVGELIHGLIQSKKFEIPKADAS